MYRVFTQSTSVINDVSNDNQFTGVLPVRNVHNTASMDESLVNHFVEFFGCQLCDWRERKIMLMLCCCFCDRGDRDINVTSYILNVLYVCHVIVFLGNR